MRRVLADSALAGFVMGGELVLEQWLVYEMTGSSLGVGTLLAIHFIPLGPVGLAAGTLADRIDRRKLLRLVELALAIVFSIFALLIALDAIALWHIYALTFGSGCAFSVYFPVRAAYAYDLAGGERSVSGLGFLYVGGRTGDFAGALLTGLAIARLGPGVACAALVAAPCIAFFVLGGLRTPGVAASAESAPLRQNLREYAAELRGNRTLLTLILVTVGVEIFAFSYWTSLPELVSERLGMTAEGLGVLNSARALGGLTVAVALASSRNLRRGRIFVWAIFGLGAGLLGLAWAPTLFYCIVAVFCLAGLLSVTDVLNQSMMQSCVPDRLRGRAMGIWAFAVGVSPLGHLQMGTLASVFGVGTALAFNAAAMLGVATLTTFFAVRLRKL